MTTKFDLELICNYTENTKKSHPVGVLFYMENVTEDDEAYKLELKRKNRDLAIDAILDNKVEEYIKNKSELSHISPGEETYMGTISPKMMSINLSAVSYTDMDDIWNSVMSKLDTLTSNPMHNSNLASIAISNDPNLTDSENLDKNIRRITSRILMMSNKIAADSYIGPAKTIICGIDAANYITNGSMFMINNKSSKSSGLFNSLNVVVSDRIRSNKVIVMRSGTKPETGLNVVNNINESTYFISETPRTWERCINWFEII